MTKLAALLGASALALGLAVPAQADDLRAQLKGDMPELMELYRDLHAYPELSFQEHRTAAKLAAIARDLGFEVTESVGQTGVVAVMRNGDGPTVLLRADMDGLPVAEQTGLTFASKQVGTPASGVESGIMHACGHDTHMAGWVGAARLLSSNKDLWQGTLVMILQPAEELGEGARAMLDDGLFIRFPKPDYALAFHDAAQVPAGVIGYAKGYALANVDSVNISIPGIGGHGAYPHTAKDPIVIASALVMRLQTLVSRELNPQDPAVVTVGSFHSGTKHNIISDEAKLQITVRSYSDETRKHLLDGIARIAKAEALAAGMPDDKLPVVEVEDNYTPATYNNPELTDRVMAALAPRFEGRVIEAPPVMGGEDFSLYRRADPDNIQSFILWVGGVPHDQWAKSQSGELSLPSLHSPFWAPDAERVIATGAEALAAAAMELMPRQSG